MSNIINCRSVFTLRGSQPYILTSNWPKNFFPNDTQYIPDFSLQNVRAYNNNLYNPKFYPVNFNEKICKKQNFDSPKTIYPYESHPI